MEENNTQQEWMHPLSPKYYKGYRYEKDKHGDELWFDENNKQRKIIAYYDNGKKCVEEYYNENVFLHNEHGYARQKWDENGYIIEQDYYLNGEKITKEDWEDKKLRHVKTETDELWFDENNTIRKHISYDSNGIKKFMKIYDRNGRLHNEHGPAFIEYLNNDIWEHFYLDGKKLNKDDWEDILHSSIRIHFGNNTEIWIKVLKEDKGYHCLPKLKIRSTTFGQLLGDMEIKITPDRLIELGKYFIRRGELSKKWYHDPRGKDSWAGSVSSKLNLYNEL